MKNAVTALETTHRTHMTRPLFLAWTALPYASSASRRMLLSCDSRGVCATTVAILFSLSCIHLTPSLLYLASAVLRRNVCLHVGHSTSAPIKPFGAEAFCEQCGQVKLMLSMLYSTCGWRLNRRHRRANSDRSFRLPNPDFWRANTGF